MRRLVFALAFLLAPVVAQAQQPSIRDIIELTKAGLSEDVLLALIEVNRPVYPVDAETLKQLKQAEVSPTVIVAMVRSGRELPPEPDVQPAVVPPTPPPPQVVIIERESEPAVREVAVPVPVYVTFPTRRLFDSRLLDSRFHDGRVRDDRHDGGVRDDHRRDGRKPAEPVYWGWGGKLRPDAWKPSPADRKK